MPSNLMFPFTDCLQQKLLELRSFQLVFPSLAKILETKLAELQVVDSIILRPEQRQLSEFTNTSHETHNITRKCSMMQSSFSGDHYLKFLPNILSDWERTNAT